MSDYLIVEWEVSDGYAGPRAPHKTKIPIEDFEEGMSRDEVQNIIHDYVQEDFEQQIGFYHSDLDGAIDEGMRLRGEECDSETSEK